METILCPITDRYAECSHVTTQVFMASCKDNLFLMHTYVKAVEKPKDRFDNFKVIMKQNLDKKDHTKQTYLQLLLGMTYIDVEQYLFLLLFFFNL